MEESDHISFDPSDEDYDRMKSDPEKNYGDEENWNKLSSAGIS